MSGCERGRRTRYRNSSYQQSHHHTHQHQQHQPAPTEPPAPARGPPPPPPAQAPTTPVLWPPQHNHQHQQEKTRTTSTSVSSSSTTTSTSATCRNLLCTCQSVCMRKIRKFISSYILQNKKMLARRFLYLYIVWNGPLVPYTAHKQTCIYKQITRMQALENWKWKRNKVLRTTLIWYMNYKIICNKSPNYCGHADWYDFPPSDAT